MSTWMILRIADANVPSPPFASVGLGDACSIMPG
jgi:hypothetical protein